MTLVVDASVVVKWFIPEADSEAALRLRNGGERFIAPDHVFAEVANAIWKSVRRGDLTIDDGRAVVKQVEIGSVAIKTVPCRDLATAAFEIAVAYDRTIYDAMYVALAMQSNTRLITADGHLYNALSIAPAIAPHIQSLRDY